MRPERAVHAQAAMPEGAAAPARPAWVALAQQPGASELLAERAVYLLAALVRALG